MTIKRRRQSFNLHADSQDRIFISPIARRIAEEHHLDYSRVEGTGPNGRIIKLDIEAALAQKQEAVAPSTASPITND